MKKTVISVSGNEDLVDMGDEKVAERVQRLVCWFQDLLPQVLTNQLLAGAEEHPNVFKQHLCGALINKQISFKSIAESLARVSRVKEYVRLHFDDDQLSLNVCAHAVGLSSFHLSKLFKRATGIHFVEFVNQVRIERAKDFLRRHDLRICEVSRLSGFGSVTGFNRTFKALVKVTPTECRQSYLAGVTRSDMSD